MNNYSEGKVYFAHSKDGSNRRFTVAALLNDKNDLSFGIAVCSAEDNFVRKIGRRIATERAGGKPFSILPVDGELQHKEIINLLYERVKHIQVKGTHHFPINKD